MQRLSFIKEHISNKDKPLKGKTVVITGGSRGIGLAIGIRCAKDGANVAILAKTVTPQPSLPGTAANIKEPSILQLLIYKTQEERLCLSLVTFVVNRVSRKALRKLLKHLEVLTYLSIMLLP